MKFRLPILIVLIGIGSSISFAQVSPATDPLSKYIAIVRDHRVDPAVLRFGKDCGLGLTGVESRDAFGGEGAGSLHFVKDIATAFDNLGTDLVGIEQVWKIGGRFLIEEWNAELDSGGEARRLYCFDDRGKLQAVEESNFQIPIEDGKPWGMHEEWVRDRSGAFKALVPFEFIDLDEKPTPEPKLDADYFEFARSWGRVAPHAFPITDMKLPPELLR